MADPVLADRALSEIEGLLRDLDELPADSVRRVLSYVKSLLTAHVTQWPSGDLSDLELVRAMIRERGSPSFHDAYSRFVRQCGSEATESANRNGAEAQIGFLLSVGLTPNALKKTVQRMLNIDKSDAILNQPETLLSEDIAEWPESENE
jgi:hypothetical protein